MFTDSHCHINAEDFAADREAVILGARDECALYFGCK